MKLSLWIVTPDCPWRTDDLTVYTFGGPPNQRKRTRPTLARTVQPRSQCSRTRKTVASNANSSRPVTLSEAHGLLQGMRRAANDDLDAPPPPTEEVPRRSRSSSRLRKGPRPHTPR